MEWLKAYTKEMAVTKREERRQIEEKILNEIKKKHEQQKKNELQTLKKRIQELESELNVYA